MVLVIGQKWLYVQIVLDQCTVFSVHAGVLDEVISKIHKEWMLLNDLCGRVHTHTSKKGNVHTIMDRLI